MTVLVPWPLVLRPVPCQLEPIAVGVAQVERFVRAVVVDAVEGPTGFGQASQRVTEVGARRIEDRDVVQAGRAGGRGRPALRLPRVEAQVVVISTRGQEQRIGHAKNHIEAKDADVEGVDPVDVCRLEMNVADPGSGSDRSRRPLTRNDYGFVLGLNGGLGAHYS